MLHCIYTYLNVKGNWGVPYFHGKWYSFISKTLISCISQNKYNFWKGLQPGSYMHKNIGRLFYSVLLFGICY